MRNKVKIVIALIAVTALLAAVGGYLIWYNSADKFEGAYIGMPGSEFRDLIPVQQRTMWFDYYFYTNRFGDTIVVKTSTTVETLQCYPWFTTIPTRQAAESITEGMTVDEVVALLGKPVGSFTFGMTTLAFDLTDGSRCTVYFYQDLNNFEHYTTSIGFS